MSMRDLPDMYAQSPRPAGPMAEGIYIKQITSTHVTTIMYHLRALFVCGRTLSSSSLMHSLLCSFYTHTFRG